MLTIAIHLLRRQIGARFVGGDPADLLIIHEYGNINRPVRRTNVSGPAGDPMVRYPIDMP